MHFSLAFILVSFSSLIAAVPTRVSTSRGIAVAITKRASSLDDVIDTDGFLSGIRHSVTKFQQGFATYERNTGEPHPLSGRVPLSRRATGSNSLTNVRLWSGSISVGTPAKSFSGITFLFLKSLCDPRHDTVIFDTGISDLFLGSPRCVNCSGHTLYDPSASSTAKDLSKSFSLNSEDRDTVNGEQFTDVVQIAGLTAKPQTLGVVANETGFWSNFPADGIMGMAFQSVSLLNTPPVFQTLISEGVLTSNVFGFKLAASGSEVFLGGTNRKLYTGNFTWVPLTNQSYWQASFNSISVNGNLVVGGQAAIFDTGSAQILGDSAGTATLYGAINGSRLAPELGNGIYTIPCTFNTPISINVGGKAVSIPPAIFNQGQVSPGSSTCVGGVAFDPDMNGAFWVLGGVFLQNVYSAWDVGGGRIGFATLA